MDSVERRLRSAGYLGEIKPGQKLSALDNYILHRGGITAFFKPGLTAEDIFTHNIISKNLLLVEPDCSVRSGLVKALANTAFELWVCQSAIDAKRYISELPRLKYAVVSDFIPEHRGEVPKKYATRLCKTILKKFPEARVIGYVNSEKLAGRGFYRLVSYKEVSPEELSSLLISDAESGPWLPKLAGGE